MIKMGVENDETVSSENRERKSSKPMMEKRRRARINESLNELKHLILEAMKKDISCYSKLEKADILEMTVKYLRSLRTQQTSVGNPSDPAFIAHYRAGFNECAREVSHYLNTNAGVDVHVKSTMLSHLSAYCRPQTTSDLPKTVQQRETIALAPRHPYYPHVISSKPKTSLEIPKGITAPVQYQIIPGQLANGKIAAVLVPNQSSSPVIPQYIPVYTNKPAVDFQPLQGFQLSSPITRQDGDAVWRPW